MIYSKTNITPAKKTQVKPSADNGSFLAMVKRSLCQLKKAEPL